mmetsp:Transcript_32923/g.92451  ORF Transcript_32923/g.92451 Transcript_32923/m.92451 type:complete len:377 (-) Transcript_32923:432-1562(-)
MASSLPIHTNRKLSRNRPMELMTLMSGRRDDATTSLGKSVGSKRHRRPWKSKHSEPQGSSASSAADISAGAHGSRQGTTCTWLALPVSMGMIRSNRYSIRSRTSWCCLNLWAFHRCLRSRSSSNSPRSRSRRSAATPPCTIRGQLRTCAIASASHCVFSTTWSRRPSSSKKTTLPKLCRYRRHATRSASSCTPTSSAIFWTLLNSSTNVAVIGRMPSSPLLPSAQSSSSSRSLTHGSGSSTPNAPSAARALAATRSMQWRSARMPGSSRWELLTGKKQRPAGSFRTTCRSTPGTRSMRRMISSSTRAETSCLQLSSTLSVCVPTITMIASGAWMWIEDSQNVRASSGGWKASSSSAPGGLSRSPSRSQASSLVMTR